MWQGEEVTAAGAEARLRGSARQEREQVQKELCALKLGRLHLLRPTPPRGWSLVQVREDVPTIYKVCSQVALEDPVAFSLAARSPEGCRTAARGATLQQEAALLSWLLRCWCLTSMGD